MFRPHAHTHYNHPVVIVDLVPCFGADDCLLVIGVGDGSLLLQSTTCVYPLSQYILSKREITAALSAICIHSRA
jgi:hypothetical protein